MATNKTKNLSSEDADALLKILKSRFEKNTNRHKNLDWELIQNKLKVLPIKLWSLNEMEQSGGEPDVVGYDSMTDEYLFYDCVAESPKERRSLCYDRKALEARKENKPKDNVIDVTTSMGITLLTEEEYYDLQKLGEFDTKTSSWIATPSDIRELGGAIFADFRYGKVFIYHNGAESYYAARGFRGALRV